MSTKQTTDKKGKEKIVVKITGELPEGKLKLLTAKHGVLVEIDVEMDSMTDVARGYFKRPGLQEFSIVMGTVTISKGGEFTINDFEKFTNALMNCWLGGDERIKEDEMASYAAAMKLFSIIKPKVARIKNA